MSDEFQKDLSDAMRIMNRAQQQIEKQRLHLAESVHFGIESGEKFDKHDAQIAATVQRMQELVDSLSKMSAARIAPLREGAVR